MTLYPVAKLTDEQREAAAQKYEALLDEACAACERAGIHIVESFDVPDIIRIYDVTEAEALSLAQVAARKWEGGAVTDQLYHAADRLGLRLARLDSLDIGELPASCLDPHGHQRLLVRVTGEDEGTVFHFADGGSAKAADCKLLDTDED